MRDRLSAEGYRIGSHRLRTVIDGIILWQDRPVSGSAGNPHYSATWGSGNGCHVPQAIGKQYKTPTVIITAGVLRRIEIVLKGISPS